MQEESDKDFLLRQLEIFHGWRESKEMFCLFTVEGMRLVDLTDLTADFFSDLFVVMAGPEFLVIDQHVIQLVADNGVQAIFVPYKL